MANRLLWDAGAYVAFSRPWVVQYRNPHNYMGDFNSEVPLYQQTDELIRVLLEWKGESATMAGRLEEVAILMYEFGFLEKQDVLLPGMDSGLVHEWIHFPTSCLPLSPPCL